MALYFFDHRNKIVLFFFFVFLVLEILIRTWLWIVALVMHEICSESEVFWEFRHTSKLQLQIAWLLQPPISNILNCWWKLTLFHWYYYLNTESMHLEEWNVCAYYWWYLLCSCHCHEIFSAIWGKPASVITLQAI